MDSVIPEIKKSKSNKSSFFKSSMAKIICFLIMSTIIIFTLTGAAITRYSFVICDENLKTVVYTYESQPEKVLSQAEVTLSPNDEFTFSGIENNKAELIIHRAKKINIKVDNKITTVYMATGTAGYAINKAGIAVADDDLINVALDEPINADMNIEINRVVVEQVTEQSEIPCDVMKFASRKLPQGETKVYRAGKNGTMETVSKQTKIDGEIVEKIQLEQTVLTKPKTEKLLVGDKNAPVSDLIPAEPIKLDANGVPLNYVSKVTGKATGYSTRGRRTSLVNGCVAMNTNQFPRGTKLYIKSPRGSYVYGYSVVKDTGVAVQNGSLLVDLFFDTYAESCEFGVMNLDVYVLE